MDWSRKLAIMFRWSFLGVIVIGLFWSAWYLVFGEPPWINVRVGLSSEVAMSGSVAHVMWPAVPGLNGIIGYERFADILIAPVWAVLITLALSAKKALSENRLPVILLGLALGAASVLGTLNFSLLFGFSLGAVITIIFMLLAAVEQGGWHGIFVGITIHLFTGLVIALTFGVFAGVLFLVYAGLPLFFFALLILLSVNRKRIISWLLAR